MDEEKDTIIYIPEELIKNLEELCKDLGNSFDFDWCPLPDDPEGPKQCSGNCGNSCDCDKTNENNCENEKSCCKNLKDKDIYCKCENNDPKENFALGQKFYVCRRCRKEIQ
jgi:hypothetical protein